MKKNTHFFVKIKFILVLSFLLINLAKVYSQGLSSKSSVGKGWANDLFLHNVFIENLGQFNGKNDLKNSAIKFGSDNLGLQVYFSTSGLTYKMEEWGTNRSKAKILKKMAQEMEEGKQEEYDINEIKKEDEAKLLDLLKSSVIQVEWIGSNPAVQIEANNKVQEYYNYPNVKTGENFYFAKAYKNITYKNIYPNVDVVYSFPEGKIGIKYSLIIHPGADVSKIRMKYSGADKVSMDDKGNIHLSTVFGDIIDHAPYTFYENNNGEIPSSFEIYNNEVSFKLNAPTDNAKTIVIDPWTANPAYAPTNIGFEVESDAAGNMYAMGGYGPTVLRKYSPVGVPLWSTNCIAPFYTNWHGDLATDNAGNSFVSNGFANGMIGKINNAGVAVATATDISFIGGAFTTWEFFNLCFNAAQTVLIGGGQAGGHGMGNINQATCYASSFNAMGSFAASEVRGVCLSPNGNYYGITIFNGTGGRVFGFTPAFGVLWNVSSGYTNAGHGYTTPNVFSNPSAQNCIAASKCFIYTYNGDSLKKRDINNGALVTSLKVANGSATGLCSGVLVDTCENVYVGTTAGINVYDKNMAFVTSGGTPGGVYDIAFSKFNTEILAAGNAMVASVANLVFPCTPGALTITTGSTNATCNLSNGSATVTSVTGGNGPYTYTWLPTNTTGSVVTGLAAGIYTVIVKDNSCVPLIKTVTVQIFSNPSGTVSITSQTNVACFGANTGAASTSVTGGSGTYSFTWTPSAQTGTLASNLSAGVYTVNVLSTNGCTSVATVTITQPPAITATITSSNVLCNAATTGSAYVNANGGNGAYTYSWSNTSTTQSVTNLGSGIYSVTVKDANGCTLTQTVNITQPTALTITPNSSAPTACTGNSVTLSAIVSGGTAGYTYTWTAGPSNSNYVITQNTGGIYVYTVSGTDANLCSVSKTISVTFVTTPTVTATSNTVCFGKTATLTANGATTYTWTGGSTGATFTASPAVGITNYTVIGSSGTCTGSATASITVNPLPAPTATNTGPYCAGTSIQLNGSGATTYTWTGPSGYNNNTQNPSILSSSVTNSGTYSFAVTDANGCTNTTTTSVVVNALPVIVVNNPTVCLNQTIGLTANGGTAYAWSGPLSFTSTTQNPNILNSTLTMSGLYTVVVTSPQGCTNTAVANVTVFPLPNPAIASNNPVCVGTTLNLNGSGGAVYSWSGPNGFNSILQNPTIPNVSLPCSGIYTLIASAGTCSASITASITINPLPTMAFINSNVLCNGGNTGASSATVTSGTGPFTYFWNNAQTTSNGTNLAAGVYTLTVTDANGCISSSVTIITQPTALNLTINSSSTSACAGTPINLNGMISGGTGPNYTYTWNPGPNTSAYNVNEILAGNYTYILTSTDQNGCTISKSINLTYFAQPTVTASSATLCAGGKVTLSANGATNYTWSPGNIVGNVYTITTTNNMNLSVVGSANGCISTATAEIIVNPLPSSALQASNGKGCVPICVTFTSVSSVSVQNTTWDFGDGSSDVTPANTTSRCYDVAGNYTVSAVITDVNGCSAKATYTVECYPKPVADFNYSPYKPIVNNADVIFTDASYGTTIAKWDWYFKNLPKPHSNLQNPMYIYDEAGTFAIALVVTSDHGCIDTIVQTIVVGEDYGIYVPNAFTPNGDGLNDVFQPKGFGITKYELRIFNRWGQELMFTNDFAQGWDGIYKGQLSKEDSYTWQINLTNVFGKSHELTGHVTLIK